MFEDKTIKTTRPVGRPRGRKATKKNEIKHQLRQDQSIESYPEDQQAIRVKGNNKGNIKNSKKSKKQKFVDPIKAAMAKELIDHEAVIWCNLHGIDIRNMTHRALKHSKAKVINACKAIVKTYERGGRYVSGLMQSVRYMFYNIVDKVPAVQPAINAPAMAAEATVVDSNPSEWLDMLRLKAPGLVKAVELRKRL